MAACSARLALLAANCALGLIATGTVCAQGYPDRPIRIVVSFPPGGSTDFCARILAQRMPPTLGQSMVVDNRGGAGGNIGNDIVAKAAPDGYTLLITAEGTLTLNPSVYAKLPYVALRDITAITQLIKYANVVVVHPSVPVTSVKELIAFVKSQPGKLSYSHPGVGTVQQLAVEMFKLAIGADIISVPFKGGGPAMVSLVGNETQLSFATPPSAMPHVKGGRLRAIAVTSDKRSPAAPDLPTISEAGLTGFNVEGWVGLLAPAKTPAAIIDRLYRETARVLAMPEVKELALGVASETVGNPPQEANTIMRDETAMWAKVVKSVGVKIE